MKAFRSLALAGTLACTFAQSAKNPPPRKPQIEELRATGCVRIARDGCVLLKTLDGKTTYTFQIAPKPDEGTVITIQGAAHRGRSECRQGVVIDVTDWEPTGEMCAE